MRWKLAAAWLWRKRFLRRFRPQFGTESEHYSRSVSENWREVIVGAAGDRAAEAERLGSSCLVKLEEIAGCTEHGPFAPDIPEPAQKELSEPSDPQRLTDPVVSLLQVKRGRRTHLHDVGTATLRR